jgi:outer membrane murein-binding lipoprotein Lpp
VSRAVAALAVALLAGCASLQPESHDLATNATELKAKADAAIGNVCKAAVTLCNIYETLPADARNHADDAACADARVFCAGLVVLTR